MKDLISRQALCEYALNQKDKSITPNDIMRFPSAQPDSKELSGTHKALDTVSRQAVIDALDKIFPADPMRNDYTQGITCGVALATEYIKQLPSAQPETHEERTETHACDCISRQATIDAMENVDWYHISKDGRLVHGANSDDHEPLYKAKDVYTVLNTMPSAQPQHDISKANFLCPICGAEMEVAVSEWEGENE